MLKFKNGLEVDECTECNGSGGWWVEDYLDPYSKDWENCECCCGTGYDTQDYEQYMREQGEDDDAKEREQKLGNKS